MIAFVVLDIVIFYILYQKFNKSKKLSKHQKQQFLGMLQSVKSYGDDRMKIIELDKILDTVLFKKGYKGSFGQKLKSNPSCLLNLNDVWFAHKIRNKIAHEAGYVLSSQEAKKGISIFEKNIRHIIKNS